jgi:hypothetical protein
MDRKAGLFVVVTSIAAGLTGLAACVGDEPAVAVSPTPDGDGGGGGTDAPATSDGPQSGNDAGTDAADAAPDPCAVTKGAFIASKTFPFVGINHGVAGTSNGGYVFAGDFRSNNGSVTYGDAGAISGSGNTMDAAVVRFNPDGSLKWQAHFGGTGSETFQGVTLDDKDDVYVAGYFSSPTFTIGTAFANASGANLGIVAKLDGATGAPIWAHSFAPGYFGYGCSAIDFDSGRLVVSCSMGTSQTYDKGPSMTGVLVGAQPAGAAVYGLDPATGYVLWGLGFGATTADNTTATNVYSVDVTPAGTVVAGTFSGGTFTAKQTNAITLAQIGTKTNGFVTELSASATGALPVWAKGFGDATSAGDVYSVSAAGTSMTGIVVGGAFAGQIDFGGGPHATIGGLDAFAMMLLNKAGPPAWEKFFGGALNDTIGRVRLDACGRAEALMLAHDALPVTDGVIIPAPQAAGVAAIMLKLEPAAGKLLWASGVTPGGSSDLTGINNSDFGIDTHGNTLVVGDFRGTIDFGNAMPVTAVGGSDPFVLVYGP